MSLEVKRICYSEEPLLNKTNQNCLPLSMQNEIWLNKHNPTPINPLSSETISPRIMTFL
jgi:hypothetical protein